MFMISIIGMANVVSNDLPDLSKIGKLNDTCGRNAYLGNGWGRGGPQAPPWSNTVVMKARTVRYPGRRLSPLCKLLWVLVACLSGISAAFPQDYWDNIRHRPSTLGLEGGIDTFQTAGFQLRLVRGSQTVAGLSPRLEPGFDFTPADRLPLRDKDSLYQLGDINFRFRKPGTPWASVSTAYRRAPVAPLPVRHPVLAGADLGNTLPANMPLRVERFYETAGEDLILRFVFNNISDGPVEVGAVGVPMVFNNILEGKSLDEAHATTVFFDPYMGMDAGYLEVKRLHGNPPGLLVLPEENFPFENYRPLLDDPGRRSVVFEGFHEWMGYSAAYADNDWKGVEQWNAPGKFTLKPGESRRMALRLALNPGIETTDARLTELGLPVALGVPGYVIPMDVKARLYVKYGSPVASVSVVPDGALQVSENGNALNRGGYREFHIEGLQWGRARLEIRFSDGKLQTVHYKVIKSEGEVVRDYGRFLTTRQWFDDAADPFGRAPSVITYDNEAGRQVTQDRRAWIAGLGDEGGSGSWLGAVMKQWVLPDAEEIRKLESFMQETLWGRIQYAEDSLKYGVRKSLFYYEPDLMPAGTYEAGIDYSTWAAWNREHAYSVGRSYNYPHVAAAHWVFYKLARYQVGYLNDEQWPWYLDKAYQTAVAMTELAPHYAQFGQMEGTVFLLILEDLKREGWHAQATRLEKEMEARALHWRSHNYPFGSEMPWDSTGQEEVYLWSDYFGFDEKAAVTLRAILAYMPAIPHWAYNGNARRYWDFLYGGKLSRIERQIHHYGSGLNAIPALAAFRKEPDRFHLLRIGYGGRLGAIANITEKGFGPSAFHSFPSTLAIDGISGDYGPGFFGYAVNDAAYLVEHPDLGWLGFGADPIAREDGVEFMLSTASGRQVFLGPEKLWIRLDAGRISRVVYFPDRKLLRLYLGAADAHTPYAYLRSSRGLILPGEPFNTGTQQIPLRLDGETEIDLSLSF